MCTVIQCYVGVGEWGFVKGFFLKVYKRFPFRETKSEQETPGELVVKESGLKVSLTKPERQRIFASSGILLVTHRIYSRRLHPIGHTHSIFSLPGFLLVTYRVYSHRLASYWSHTEYILIVWHPIGHTQGIFSLSGILLVTHRVYSHCLASFWSHKEYILIVWHPVGHKLSTFSSCGILLVTHRVYSRRLTSYRLHTGYILFVWHPIGALKWFTRTLVT